MERPKIIICRHAESTEDVDKSAYDTMTDLEMPLTENGMQQASEFGIVLAQLLEKSSYVRFYTSPGVRNTQTLKAVLPKLPDSVNVQVEIEPLIAKQNWGTITAENRSLIEAERYEMGVLRYTFPTGESAASMIGRLMEFKEKIFALQNDTGHEIVVFSHGFEFRVLLMVIFGWDEELFESFGNLTNCEYRILTRQQDGCYALDRPLRKREHPITRLRNKT